ncbi:HTH-type transcriptional regulator gltC [Dermatophilus congolensis]|uniref:HTH-type transcriptional regulator gltC n=2 Tax=Dermatophilus congolensis TaxID=1863 RepID=A0AA46H055_9MICO|nr:HTH-type transcriptional regulator gltC [Dermatophilus congolensis]
MISNMIDIAGFRVMRAIADAGSFTSAAASLGYSQPAISQMVRRLEQRTGTTLVERVGRTVRLTEAGEVLARHATAILTALEQAEDEISAIAGLESGRVRLMAFPSASAAIVPAALAQLRETYPGITVTFTEGEPPQALAALRAGECDIALVFAYDGAGLPAAEDNLETLHAIELFDDPVHVALPRQHPLTSNPVVNLADLTNEDWIAGCPRCRGHLLDSCNLAGFRPRVTYETEDYMAVLGFVGAGLGAALIPALNLSKAIHPDVAIRDITPQSHRTVYAVTTPDLFRVPAVATTLHALTDSAEHAHTSPEIPATLMI